MTDKEIEDLIHNIVDIVQKYTADGYTRMRYMEELVEIFHKHMKNKLILDTSNSTMMEVTQTIGGFERKIL